MEKQIEEDSKFTKLSKKLKQILELHFHIQSAFFTEHEGKKTEYDVRSLWIIKGDWWIRRKLVWLVEWKPFEKFIILVILGNSIMLACTDYQERIIGTEYVSIQNLNIGQVDIAFTIIFLVECICKILAMGFVLHKKSYLRDKWNWLDIFVVSVSVVTWLPGFQSNASMKSLRTFRILRPLRSIKSIPSLKAQIQTLISSIPGMINVFIFLGFIFTIFAIFGTNQFLGAQYNRCRMTDAPQLINGTLEWPINYDAPWLCNYDEDCARMLGDSVVAKCSDLLSVGLDPSLDAPETQSLIFYNIVNFDNVPIAIFSVFQCLTLESWSYMMYNYMASNNQYIAVFYFCFLVIFGSFFAIQLVLANIMDSFAQEQLKKQQAIMEEKNKEDDQQNFKNLFVNALKQKEEVKQERKIPIANNAVIQNKQTVRVQNEYLEEDSEFEISDEDFDQILILEEFVTNRNEENVFATIQSESLDFSKQQDWENTYEFNARKRSNKNWLYIKLFALVNLPLYNFFLFALILINTISLASDDYPQSLRKQETLEILNQFFCWAFTAEMIVKMIALGPNNYVHDKFNLFDMFVVSLSLIDWTLNIVLSHEQLSNVGSIMSALRAFRLLRIIKLARSWKTFQDIISKTLKSAKAISSFGVLLFLFLYIYALLGMEMFSNKIRLDWNGNYIANIPASVKAGDIMKTPYYNFDNIYNSLVVVFCAILAEDWNNSMYSFINSNVANRYLVMFYFWSLMVFGNIMLLSLFTAILLQHFEPSVEEIEKAQQKTLNEFNIKTMFTRNNLTRIKDQIVRIFDPQSKRFDSKTSEIIKVQPKIIKQEVSQKQTLNNDKQLASLIHYKLSHGKQQDESKVIGTQIQVHDSYSLFIFSPTNNFRTTCQLLIKNKYFDWFILILIAISTICLAIQNPLDDPTGKKSQIMNYIDYFMTAFFVCEMMTKIFALGFAFCGPDSYIRNSTNTLDFIIVVSSVLDTCLSNIDLSVIKSVRVMRVLRPLRLLKTHRGLRLAILALTKSLPQIINLLAIILFFIFLLGILCCTFFKGAFWKCSTMHLIIDDFIQAFEINTRYECILYGGEWINADYQFDTIFSSMLTLVSIQSTEGWVDNMWQMVKGVGPEMQPKIDQRRSYCVFAIFMQFGMTLLFLNLFVGVVIESFNTEKDKLSLNQFLKKVEKIWIETLTLCYSAKPGIITTKTHHNYFRDLMITISESLVFDKFILICIISNAIALSLKWYGQSQQMLLQLDIVNIVFGVIFSIEAIIKIYAQRQNYFRQNWNRFDFTVVVLTWIVQIISWLDLPFDVAIVGMIARTLRIGRIFRIANKIQSVQIILKTLIEALPAISALGLLLGLIFFLYTIIGISQFAFINIKDQNDQLDNQYVNFQTFFNGILILMRDSTGEAWDSIMFDCARQNSILFQCQDKFDWYDWMNSGQIMNGCGSPQIAYTFFYSFNVIVCQIFLNLFIAVIIDAFLGQSEALGQPVNQSDINEFIEAWQDFDPDGTGFIDCFNIEKFIFKLALTKSKLLQNKQRILKNTTYRRRLIALLEIPSHNKFEKFLFVDTLQCMSRVIVEHVYIREQYASTKQAMLGQKMGKDVVNQAIKDRLDNIDHKAEFQSAITGILDLNENIASLQQLKITASKMSKKQLVGIDIQQNDDQTQAEEIYSSRHYIYGELIVKAWRDFQEKTVAQINLENQ